MVPVILGRPMRAAFFGGDRLVYVIVLLFYD